MTINGLIKSLESAKNELGGDEEVFTSFECKGDGDCVKIKSLKHSKHFKLRFEIEPPWWAYPKHNRD